MAKREASDLDKIVGVNLNKYRTVAGFSQKALGNACAENLSSQQISKFELGINRISSIQLVEFAAVCGVTVLDLLAGVTEALPPGEIMDRRDQRMMENYQQLPEDMQESLRNFVGAIAKSVSHTFKGAL